MSGTTDEQADAYLAGGQRLRELRQEKGLSQEAVGMTANIDQSSFSKLERIGLNQMSLKKLEAVAKAMDCVLEINFRPRKNVPATASEATARRR